MLLDASTFGTIELGGLGVESLLSHIKLNTSSQVGYKCYTFKNFEFKNSNVLYFQVSYELSGTSELYFESSLGCILPVGSSVSIHPCDKFFIGGVGAQGLRGFMQYGIGPKGERRYFNAQKVCYHSEVSAGTAITWFATSMQNERQYDALGGLAMASLLGALRFDFPSPSLASLGLKGQLFCNVGTLLGGEDISNSWARKRFAKDLSANLRVSIVRSD